MPPKPLHKRLTRRTLAWGGGVVAAALAAALTGLLTSVFTNGVSRVREPAKAPPPFDWQAQINHDQCEGASRYRALASLPARPASPQFGISEKERTSAPDGAYTDVAITFQGKSDTATVLQAIHVQVKRARPSGALVELIGGCGGILPRFFAVDLDDPNPRATPSPGKTLGPGGPSPVPAVPFPFRISSTDPEVFHVIAATRSHDCQWRITVDWTSGARSGAETIDDHGRPFRTVGAEGIPVYAAGTTGWERRPAPASRDIPVR